MQNDSRRSSAFKLETAGNRSLFLSLANQGSMTVVALWKETSMLSSENHVTKVLSGLLQRAQVLQHDPLPFLAGRCFERHHDHGAQITWQEVTSKRQVLQASFSGTLRTWGVETMSKRGLGSVALWHWYQDV